MWLVWIAPDCGRDEEALYGVREEAEMIRVKRDVVYFLLDEIRNKPKIGYTSLEPCQRFKTIAFHQRNDYGCMSLRCLGVLPGDRTLESQLHERFAHLRLRGKRQKLSDWFTADAELMDFVASANIEKGWWGNEYPPINPSPDHWTQKRDRLRKNRPTD